MLLHIYTMAPTPMLDEALAAFAAAKHARQVPAEPAWSGLIKLHCACGNAEASFDTISEMAAAGVLPKLRSFSPIISLASSTGNQELAQRVLHEVKNRQLVLGTFEHLELVRLAQKHAEPSAVVKALRHMKADSPQLLPAHADHLCETLGCPPLSAADSSTAQWKGRAEQAVVERNQLFPKAAIEDSNSGSEPAEQPGLLTGIVQWMRGESSRPSGWQVQDCRTNAKGVCSCSGLTLQAAELLDAERQELATLIPTLIGPKKQTAEFSNFLTWLDKDIAQHGPYNYVLDGANIGFYGHSKVVNEYKKAVAEEKKGKKEENKSSDEAVSLSSTSGVMRYFQIDALVSEVRRVTPGARILIVLHVAHTRKAGFRPDEQAIISKWRDSGILYDSPAGMNDDWYWLHAAITSGPACRAVTNDEMRDHTFGAMASRAFLKWKERNVIHFDFPWDPGRNSSATPPQPELQPPLPYSHIMQEDQNGMWHLPRADQPGSWVALCPPR
jgi:hypothetical protein